MSFRARFLTPLAALLLLGAGALPSCAPEYAGPDLLPPATVTATPADASVTLDWTAVGDASSYRIFWNTIGGVTQSDGSVAAGGVTYTMKKLTNGQSYSFAVASVSAGGTVGSGLSKEVAAVPAPAIPAAPKNLAAVAGLGFVTLTWSPSSGATGYTLFYAGQAGVTDKSAPLKVGKVTTFTHENLPFSVTYYYRVQASNLGGDSELSNEVFATLPPDPNLPPAP